MDLIEMTLIGTLGQDPVKRISETYNIANFSVATNVKRKDQSYTIWTNITSFGKNAEMALSMLKKGVRVFIQGNVTEFSYTQEGESHETKRREVIANRIIVVNWGKQANDNKNKAPDSTEVPF